MVTITDFNKLQDSNPIADVSQAISFLDMFKGNILIANLDQEGGFHQVRTKEDLRIYMQEWVDSKLQIFFVVNDSSGRKALDVTEIRAVWADIDVKSPIKTDWPIEPSIVVNTSPGKYHYYWLTTTPGNADDIDVWNSVQEQFVTNYGADQSSNDIARVLRVPGSFNFKPGHTNKVDMVSKNGKVYEWKEIIKNFKPSPITLVKPTEHVAENLFDEQIEFKKFINGLVINKSLVRYVQSLAYYATKTKIKKHVGVWFDAVPTEIMQEHKARYISTYNQLDKIIDHKLKLAREYNTKKSMASIPDKVIVKPLEDNIDTSYYPIPEECMPEAALIAAKEVQRFNNNGFEPAVISILLAASALLNKNVEIHEMDDSLITFSSIGIIIAMVSGTRKTQTFKELATNIYEYEATVQDEWEAEKNLRKTRVEGLEANVKALARDAQKSGKSDSEKDVIYKEIAAKRDKIDELDKPMPSLIIKDITEEAVLPIMKDNNGAIAILADDSRNVIKNILGRQAQNQGDTSEAWMIDCFGGIRAQSNRVKFEGKPLVVNYPCLNVLMFVQPDMAIKLKYSSVYTESGLAARLPIYFYPVDTIDMLKRSNRNDTLDRSKLEPYLAIMRQLQVHRQGSPMKVVLTDGAKRVCNNLNTWFIEKLVTLWLGDYDKLNKLVTQSVIYATIIAALDDEDFRLKLAVEDKDFKYVLSTKYMNMGAMFIRALYEGMQLSTISLDNTKLINEATAFAKALVKHYNSGKIYEGFAANSYLYQCINVLNKDNYRDIIQLLVDKSWLLPVEGTVTRELNMGFPKGKVTPGETIYHLNLKRVEAMLVSIEKKKQELYLDNPGE